MTEKSTMLQVCLTSGLLSGDSAQKFEKRLGELRGIFKDAAAFAAQDPEQVIYRVQMFAPVPDGTEGGLFWGNTTIEPGKVGNEYFMTKGHFHQIRNRAEYYVTVVGTGALLLMDEDGRTRAETMSAGSVHYIPGSTAHRVANTGRDQLTFLACWPSDAGHDYASIERDGFGARILEVNGKPEFVTRVAS